MGTRLGVMVSVAFVASCTALVLVAIQAVAQNGGGGNGGGGSTPPPGATPARTWPTPTQAS